MLHLVWRELGFSYAFTFHLKLIGLGIDFGDDAVAPSGFQITQADHPAVIPTFVYYFTNINICHATILWIVMILVLISHFYDKFVYFLLGQLVYMFHASNIFVKLIYISNTYII